MDVMVIGIAGGTGSGKTTVTQKLKEHFGDDVSVVYHDNYYKRHDEMPYETDLLVADLDKLRRGEPAYSPVYDYSIHNRTDQVTLIPPAKVILVEGILIFSDPALRQRMDIRIFVDTDADVRILRRILRDVKERGRTLDSVVDQYLTTVKVMHEQYVQPSRRYADIVMLEGGHNLVALDMIMERIRSHLAGA